MQFLFIKGGKKSYWHLSILKELQQQAFGTLVNYSESHYCAQMEKTWKCGEPSQEWPALKWLQDATDNIQDVTKEPRATSKELWA